MELAVTIVDQESAYSDAQGKSNLRKYKPGPKYVMVQMNDELDIAILKSASTFQIYLVRGSVAVGKITLLRVSAVDNIWTPVSYFDAAYRGKGYASALYSWVLNAGMTLLSSAEQSKFSSALWHRLAKKFTLVAVNPDARNAVAGSKALRLMTHPDYDLALLAPGKRSKIITDLFWT